MLHGRSTPALIEAPAGGGVAGAGDAVSLVQLGRIHRTMVCASSRSPPFPTCWDGRLAEQALVAAITESDDLPGLVRRVRSATVAD
jgi:hypothetical protein